MAVYLDYNTINDSSSIKLLAQECNIETTDNTTIDTNKELSKFISGIVSLFSKGSITVDIAKKYIGNSSSLFCQNNEYINAYTKGILGGIDVEHNEHSSRLSRWLCNSEIIQHNIEYTGNQYIHQYYDKKFNKLNSESQQLTVKYKESEGNEKDKYYTLLQESRNKLRDMYSRFDSIYKTFCEAK